MRLIIRAIAAGLFGSFTPTPPPTSLTVYGADVTVQGASITIQGA